MINVDRWRSRMTDYCVFCDEPITGTWCIEVSEHYQTAFRFHPACVPQFVEALEREFKATPWEA